MINLNRSHPKLKGPLLLLLPPPPFLLFNQNVYWNSFERIEPNRELEPIVMQLVTKVSIGTPVATKKNANGRVEGNMINGFRRCSLRVAVSVKSIENHQVVSDDANVDNESGGGGDHSISIFCIEEGHQQLKRSILVNSPLIMDTTKGRIFYEVKEH